MELRRRRAHPSVSMTIPPLVSSPSLTTLARTDAPEPTAPRAAVAPPKPGDGFALGPDPTSAFSRFADTELWGKKKPKAKPSSQQPASKPAVKATAAPSPAEVEESKRKETMKQLKTEFGLGDLRDGDAKWTTGELAALKLTLGNLPAADRAKLKDVSFVRDHAKDPKGTKATETPGTKTHENPSGKTHVDFDPDADGRRTGKSATIRLFDEAFPSDLEIQSYDRRSTFERYKDPRNPEFTREEQKGAEIVIGHEVGHFRAVSALFDGKTDSKDALVEVTVRASDGTKNKSSVSPEVKDFVDTIGGGKKFPFPKGEAVPLTFTYALDAWKKGDPEELYAESYAQYHFDVAKAQRDPSYKSSLPKAIFDYFAKRGEP